MSFSPDQGAITCPNCGNQAPVGSSFCPVCGQALSSTLGPPPAYASAPAPAPVVPTAPFTAPPPPSAPPPLAPAYGQPQAYGQPPTAQQSQGYGSAAGYPAGYGYAAPPARGSSATPVLAVLALVGLVVVVVAGAVMLSSAGGSHATSAPSAFAHATTAVPTDTPEPVPTDTPIPKPTIEPTPAGTDWETFSTYALAQLAVKREDMSTWNAASDAIKTRLAVNKAKADAQADLAWLQAHPPMDCYLRFYKELILYDNQLIKTMDDWLAGRYSVINKSDVPAINATWNLFEGEIADAQAAC